MAKTNAPIITIVAIVPEKVHRYTKLKITDKAVSIGIRFEVITSKVDIPKLALHTPYSVSRNQLRS